MFLDTYLDRSAERRAQAPAFRFNGRDLTYGILKDRADDLAAWLNGKGIGRGDRVAICLNKGLDMPVAVFGILKSGAAYVPLDPAAPAERLAAILNDCGISCLITDPAILGRLPDLTELVPGLTDILGGMPEDMARLPGPGAMTAAPPAGRSPEDPAYILFTSGSTGTPKGMVHSHRSGRAFVDMVADHYRIGPEDRMGNVSPLHFDMAMMEVFGGIARGALVVLVPEMILKLPASLSQLIEAERLTTLYSVPFALIQIEERGALDKRDLSALRLVAFAGEPMSPKHLNALQRRLPGVRFSNAYGPAEVNVVTIHDLPAAPPHAPTAPVPIGRACAGVDLLIEDGLLLIATPAMMSGYWKRPDLDRAAFVSRTDASGVARRYYRSGDVVRTDPDGVLHFCGRRDRQVKIRGFRIELEEVELALMAHEAVREAVVMPAPDGLSLVAYATLGHGRAATGAEIEAFLRMRLPAHAVPAGVTILLDFPRTATGKVNRNALVVVEIS